MRRNTMGASANQDNEKWTSFGPSPLNNRNQMKEQQIFNKNTHNLAIEVNNCKFQNIKPRLVKNGCSYKLSTSFLEISKTSLETLTGDGNCAQPLRLFAFQSTNSSCQGSLRLKMGKTWVTMRFNPTFVIKKHTSEPWGRTCRLYLPQKISITDAESDIKSGYQTYHRTVCEQINGPVLHDAHNSYTQIKWDQKHQLNWSRQSNSLYIESTPQGCSGISPILTF